MLLKNLIVLLGFAGCLGGPAGPDRPVSRHYRVLFIGNSLTYFNNLPGTLSQLASSAGDSIEVATVARPNFALIDHANGLSNAVQVIRSSRWDFVILQQGPTSLPINRDTLILATITLDPDIRASGARSAQMMTWPEAGRQADFDAVRLSSERAAQAVDGVFLPVGEAWRTAWASDPSIPLYGPDGFHPAPLGTYLAALVIYQKITSHDPRDLPPRAVVNGIPLDLSSTTVRLLQHAAYETVNRYPDCSD